MLTVCRTSFQDWIQTLQATAKVMALTSQEWYRWVGAPLKLTVAP